VTGAGSRSAVLDRMEHEFSIDGNYQVLPKTTLSLGYIYRIEDFTSDDLYTPGAFGFPRLLGNARDWNAHIVTVGVRQQLNPQFVVSAKVGAEFTTYDRDDIWDDEISPYAEASGSWNYTEGSALQLGVRHRRVPTDVRFLPTDTGVPGAISSDAEATSVFVSLTHQIMPKLLVNALAQFQYASFNESIGSSVEDAADLLFYGGLTVTYQFTRNVAAEAGYTYDRLDSDVALRSFTRNRVFVGTRLTF
jgi:uncharacterized protein (PEP-CTERM system associated)